MNERLKQLAEKAGFMVDQSGSIMVCFTSNGDSEVKKFAELIVRDVLVICDAVSEPFEDSEMDKNIPGALVVAEMIRENFGVLE